jgi:hypothetical protein
VRKFDGAVNPAWFGFVNGDNSANTTANDAAMAAMLSCLTALAVNPQASNWRSLYEVKFGLGCWHFATTVDLTSGAIAIRGMGVGTGNQANSAGPTKLVFHDCTAFRIQDRGTSGSSTKDASLHYGANNSILSDFALQGMFTGTEAEYHGIHARGTIYAENINIRYFAGDGVLLDADSVAGGNATCIFIKNVMVNWCRNGFRSTGNNSGGGLIVGGGAGNNRRWGIS